MGSRNTGRRCRRRRPRPAGRRAAGPATGSHPLLRTRAEPISMYRKRPFAIHGRRPLPARAAVCRIPCLILCLAYVERVGQCRAPNAPCGVYGRMASVIAALFSRSRPPSPASSPWLNGDFSRGDRRLHVPTIGREEGRWIAPARTPRGHAVRKTPTEREVEREGRRDAALQAPWRTDSSQRPHQEAEIERTGVHEQPL